MSDRRADAHSRVGRLVLVAALPAAGLCLILPPAGRSILALAGIILLGIPHGALDGELARPFMRRHFGRAWFLVFSLPYLTLAGGVLLAWHVAPVATLVCFLAASATHFGLESEDATDALDRVVIGGLPIALPFLFHPEAVRHIFATVMQAPADRVPPGLYQAAFVWIVPAIAWFAHLARHRPSQCLLPLMLILLFAILPPLVAFAIYFVCIHAPAHVAGLIGSRTAAPRVRSRSDAILRSLPVTGLTLLIGAALWPLYPGAASDRLLSLTLQGLAALTLPHMLLDLLMARPAWFGLSMRKGGLPALARLGQTPGHRPAG